MPLLAEMRRAGFRCDRDYTGKSLRKQMQAADKLGVRFVVVIGDDDISKKTLSVKNLRDSTQQELAWSSDLGELKEHLIRKE